MDIHVYIYMIIYTMRSNNIEQLVVVFFYCVFSQCWCQGGKWLVDFIYGNHIIHHKNAVPFTY